MEMSIDEKRVEDLTKKLMQLNVNDHTEAKNGLTYLSWAWAWQKLKEYCPTATYEIKMFADEKGLMRPYIYDENLGYMVFTSVTAYGLTHTMWLPVMDNANKTMKNEPYHYTTKSGEKEVDAATMFDINKAIMRCLTKNISMFGIGIYIYAGEDIPMEIKEPCTAKQVERMRELKVNEANVLRRYKVSSLEELTYIDAEFVINTKVQSLKEQAEATKEAKKEKTEEAKATPKTEEKSASKEPKQEGVK